MARKYRPDADDYSSYEALADPSVSSPACVERVHGHEVSLVMHGKAFLSVDGIRAEFGSMEAVVEFLETRE